MTGGAFTAWNAVAPDHNNGFFALALQDTPGVFKEPNIILRETGGTGFLPDETPIVPGFFSGTQFEPAGQAGASGYDSRTVNVELDARTIAVGLRMMFGEPVVAAGVGTITPYSNRQWAAYFPARSFSGYWYVPTIGYVKITDGQLYMLQATVPDGDGIITGQLGFHAANAEYVAADSPGFAVPAIAVPDFVGGFTRSDASLVLNGVTEAFEGGITLNVNRPIDPGARLGRFTGNYKPGSAYVNAEVQTTLTGGRPDMIKRRNERDLKPLEMRFQQGDPAAGGVRISLKAPTAQIVAADAPISDGAVTTTATARAVIPNPAAKPFTFELQGNYA